MHRIFAALCTPPQDIDDLIFGDAGTTPSERMAETFGRAEAGG